MQGSFPIAPRPYAAVAELAGRDRGGGSDPNAARCSTSASSARSRRSSTRACSATARCSWPPRSTRRTRTAPAKVINSHPGVSHNYLRDHDFNIWFTIATEPGSALGLEGTLEVLAATDRAPSPCGSCPRCAVQDPDGPGDGEGHRRAGRAPRPWTTGARGDRAVTTSTSRSSARRRADGGGAGAVRAAPAELGIAQDELLAHPGVDARAPRPAPRRRDPLPPPRRLLRQRHGRLAGARGADPGAGPADGVVPRHLALLPAADLPGLALLGLHDGARALEGGVRRDPRLDRRGHRHRGAPDALLLHRVQEDAGCATSPTSTSGGKRSTRSGGRAPPRPTSGPSSYCPAA